MAKKRLKLRRGYYNSIFGVNQEFVLIFDNSRRTAVTIHERGFASQELNLAVLWFVEIFWNPSSLDAECDRRSPMWYPHLFKTVRNISGADQMFWRSGHFHLHTLLLLLARQKAILYSLKVCHPRCVKSIIQCVQLFVYSHLHAVKNKTIRQMVSLRNMQHYVIYNYMFRPCKWAISRLFVEPVSWLYNRSLGEGRDLAPPPNSYCIFDVFRPWIIV